MEPDDGTIGLAVSMGVNWLLLYSRKSKWLSDLRRWLITVALLLIGLVVYFTKKSFGNDYLFLSWCLATPLIFNIMDRTLQLVSMKILHRDFYLWLRYSDEIDYSIGGINPHIHWLDKVISMILLILAVLLPLLGATKVWD